MLSLRDTESLSTSFVEIDPGFNVMSIGLYCPSEIVLSEYTETGWGANQTIPAGVPFYKQTSCQKIRLKTSSGIADVNYSLDGFKVFLRANAVSQAVSGDTTLDAKETVLVTCSTANINITLPSAVTSPNKVYNIKKVDSTGYLVNILTTGGQTIDGESSISIDTPKDCITVQSDGTNWRIL